MSLPNALETFVRLTWLRKRRIINAAFFSLVVVNMAVLVLLGIRHMGKSAIGVLVIYSLGSFIFYVIPMYVAPFIIRRERNRGSGLAILPQAIAVIALVWMFVDQIAWLIRLVSKF